MRKLSSRNFGLKNRDMTLALKNALKEQGYAYKTIDDYTKHASSFVAFIESNLVTTLNEIKREHVEKYGLYVQNKFHLGDISLGTAHMKICAVNTLLRCARMDEKLSVYTVKDMKILKRNHIAKENKSSSSEKHKEIKSFVSERLAAQLDLQRYLGLRFKESCLIDATKASKEAQLRGSVRITEGTKGGRSRIILVHSEQQRSALTEAAKIQGKDKSMIPPELSYKTYKNQYYAEVRMHSFHFHSERHAFANNEYRRLMKVDSPVISGCSHGKEHIAYLAIKLNVSHKEAKMRDLNVRQKIAEFLGHGRISITNNYLG